MTIDPNKPNHVVDIDKTASEQFLSILILKNQRFRRILKDG